MTATQQKAELTGKTVEWAGIVERPSGDAEFLMRLPMAQPQPSPRGSGKGTRFR